MVCFVALTATLLLSGQASGADLAAIRDCVAENTPRISSIHNVSIQVKEGGEDGFRSQVKILWRKLRSGERRILLRFSAPEDLKDAGVLVNTRPSHRAKVHIYLPGQGNPRSMHSRGELQGFLGRANLGIEELELLLDPLGGEDIELLREHQKLDGRPVWVLEEREEEGGDTRYPRKLTFIDHEYCIPVRAEFYDEGVQQKTMIVDLDTVTRVAESWVPRRLLFRDLIQEADTELDVTDIEVDAAFSPALLTVKALPKPSR